MHIYKDTETKVTFTHPYSGNLNAILYLNGLQVGTRTDWPSVGGSFTIPITYSEIQDAGQLKIEWWAEGGGFKRDQYVDVVCPIAPLDYIQAAINESGTGNTDPDIAYQQLRDLETSVRLIIESYTGQTFYPIVGTRVVKGLNELTKVLSSAVSVTSIQPPLTADLGEHFTTLGIKQAPPEGFQPGFDGVIRIPNDYYKNVTYSVSGVWGYREIPAAVQEAALLLVKEYTCPEGIYRDRYLESIKYADTSFKFNALAYGGTGNVRADQLLEAFKFSEMIVV